MKLKVSIIISNYQGRQLLPKCLGHLMDQTYGNYEVIVIDAGSTDGSADFVSDEFPSVILLRRGRVGIGEAVNIGIGFSTGDIIIFDFNTDEFAERDWLEQIVIQLEKYDFKIITGTTRLIYGTDLIDECGVNLKWFGQARKRGHMRLKGELLGKDEPALYVGCPAFHRDILEAVGPIEEGYRLYGEDLDFCYRASLIGFETRPTALALSHHMIRGTTGKSSRHLEFYLRRAYLKFHISFSSVPRVLINICYLALFLVLTASIAAISPIQKASAYREKLMGRTMALIWYCRTFPENFARRRRFKHLRRRKHAFGLKRLQMRVDFGVDQ